MPKRAAKFPRPQVWFAGMVKRWNVLLHAATSIMATIGSFWVPPPPDLPSGNETLVSFGKFIVTILAGLAILPMMKWCCNKKHAWLWGKVTAVALILGILAFFSFQYLLNSWTVRHGDKVLYTGFTLKQDVKPFLKEHPEYSREELLENAGWDPKIIWTEQSLLLGRLILSAIYVLCIPFFAIAIMSVVQLFYCASSRS